MRDRLRLMLAVGLVMFGSVAFGQASPTVQTAPAAQAGSAVRSVRAAQAEAAQTSSAPAAPAAGAATSANLTFDVASIRPSAPLDMQKLAADMKEGKMPNFGMHLNGLRAEFNYLTLRDLITVAYKVKTYQITGPDWLNTQHFDVVARMPEGSTKDDAPKMLQALLEDRFKVAVHRETQEHQVMALVVGKSGPKMKESPGDAPPIDEAAELKPGEMKMDTADGPARMTMNKNGMGATMNMGVKGTITWSVDMQTMTLHLTSDKTTMTALADMLTQMMAQLGGAMGGADGSSRQVMDMTGLKGNYEVAMDFSMADMIAKAKAQAGTGEGGSGGGSTTVATDPGGGGQTVSGAIDKLGLKLDSRKAPVEQLIVDHAEKAPTEN